MGHLTPRGCLFHLAHFSDDAPKWNAQRGRQAHRFGSPTLVSALCFCAELEAWVQNRATSGAEVAYRKACCGGRWALPIYGWDLQGGRLVRGAFALCDHARPPDNKMEKARRQTCQPFKTGRHQARKSPTARRVAAVGGHRPSVVGTCRVEGL